MAQLKLCHNSCEEQKNSTILLSQGRRSFPPSPYVAQRERITKFTSQIIRKVYALVKEGLGNQKLQVIQ